MKTQKIINTVTICALTVWLVGCKQKPDMTDAASDAAYGENATSPATNAAAPVGESVTAAVTNVAEVVPTGSASNTAGVVRYNAQPAGSKATVSGTSSIKDWSMESGVIGGFMEVDPGFPESALTNASSAKPVAQVTVPLRTLKSGNGTMDAKMLVTMSATNYPRIEYHLLELKPKSQPGATGALEFDAVGRLTIVGKTITNTMPVTIAKQEGKLKVAGSAPIKLTQFEIKPPIIAVPLLPDITVHDDLKVDFVWMLAPKVEKKP